MIATSPANGVHAVRRRILLLQTQSAADKEVGDPIMQTVYPRAEIPCGQLFSMVSQWCRPVAHHLAGWNPNAARALHL
jgi:hypothetical protein